MTTVTLRPSEEVVARAAAEVTITDAKGRQITLRKPGILAQFRLVEAMGAEAAANETYRMMCLPLLYVAAVDGEPVLQPTSKLELEALIQRLDEAGMVAVQQGIAQVATAGAAGGGVESAKN
ncbi:hypothetical protein BKK79_20000 [Cupriavidus sp. USMAA2-4]|uniref:hypothetical protein n=1 Tax=Cupriavidus sp. USMAA2-4 TaxID=876364 RepID=UPI0008A6E850|nr:hypothetical protein [Cupriavidus sp. USMAA2-4]AOY93831.1 hypothetical protein BKK79_20000 [Cupriavidus sp. USMAA2-4]